MGLRVVCVYSVENYSRADRPLYAGFSIPFGIALIASSLQRSGHTVRTLSLAADSDPRAYADRVLSDFSPHLVCLTAVSTQFPFISRVAMAMKSAQPSPYVVVGGPHASLNPEEVIADPSVDAACVGEGEGAVVELAEALAKGEAPLSIPNLWIKDHGAGAIERNSPRPLIEDLDSLPFIDRDLWRQWIMSPDTAPAVLIGRGCPNRCAYCSNHAMKKLAEGRYVRFRSPGNIVAEISEIARNPAISEIHLEVETIGARAEYAFDLCEALADLNMNRERPLTFWINLALTTGMFRRPGLTDRLLAAFLRANIRKLNIGLESGSERVRNEVLRRPKYTNEQFVEFSRQAVERGIEISAYVMIGLPDETLEDWRRTIDVLRESRINEIQLSIFYPYPGTDICRYVDERGLRGASRPDSGSERRDAVLILPGFPRWRILTEYALCEFKVFKGKWSLTKRCYKTLAAGLRLFPGLERLFFKHIWHTDTGNSLRVVVRRILKLDPNY